MGSTAPRVPEPHLASVLVEIRRRLPQTTVTAAVPELSDPLAALADRIRQAPHTMEHRVLARLLRGMIEESAEDAVRHAEIAAFGPAVLALLSALIDDCLAGRYDRAAILSALLDHQISGAKGTNATSG